MADNCWILVHADGREADNGEFVEHFDSEADAAKRAANDLSGDVEGCTPRQLDRPCQIVTCGCCQEGFGDLEVGHTVHFDGIETGMLEDADWVERQDGTFRCASCGSEGDCEDCQFEREVITS